MQSTSYTEKEILLLGGGHAHVGVLKSFGMKPLPGVRLTVISDVSSAPYSGMIPGHIAGFYNEEECHIDLWPLTQFAKARLFIDSVKHLDLEKKLVYLENRPPVGFDFISINTGSVPQAIPGSDSYATAVKPISHFLASLKKLLPQIIEESAPETTIVVVGAGAGGVELALSLKTRLEKELASLGKSKKLHFHLVFSGENLLFGHNQRVQNIFQKVLSKAKVTIHSGERVTQIEKNSLTMKSGKELPFDHLLLVTEAQSNPIYKESGLDVDKKGFIQVNSFLQSTSHPFVFAAGDIAALSSPRPKSGVYAVRASKSLGKNLRSFALKKSLSPYRPQKTALALIMTGEEYAVASKGIWSAQGKWLWGLKDRIDRKFMNLYQEFPEMLPPQTPSLFPLEPGEKEEEVSAMPCGGCGAKVGATLLSKIIAGLPLKHRPDIIEGLNSPDDAAVVRVPPGKVMLHTVDYFRSFWEDPYLLGKIATIHSLSDIWAMGGEAQNALAIVCAPHGREKQVEDFLSQSMRGCAEILQESNCALVGGHSTEGPEASFGLAINGLADENKWIRKQNLKPGEKIILSKALGTGTLLVAQMQGKAKAKWIEPLLASMLDSNYRACQALSKHEISSCTDVTGFGLLGHLLEMTKNEVVQIELDKLPLLPGAETCLEQGLLSSMHPKNQKAQRGLQATETIKKHKKFPILFDPQTSGGLLISIAAEKAPEVLHDLRELGYPAEVIGTVCSAQEGSFVEVV